MSATGRSDDAATIRELEEEIMVLRRRLQDAPRRVRLLEERLLDVRNQLAQATSQNEKLTAALSETREQLALLRDEVEKLTAPPNPFGTVLQMNTDGTVDILSSGRKLRVAVEPNVEIKELERGQEVILNEAFGSKIFKTMFCFFFSFTSFRHIRRLYFEISRPYLILKAV